MARTRVSLILLAAYVALSTGLVLAVHLHVEHDGHDSQGCGVCAALNSPSPALPTESALGPDPLAASPSNATFMPDIVISDRTAAAFLSRAPPRV
jgi:hypothetical protein